MQDAAALQNESMYINMRKFLLASAAAITLSTGALAADLPIRGPALAPAPVFVAMNWTGFYVGAQVGGT